MKTFIELHNELLASGFKNKGQNGRLGHIYEHEDGRTALVDRALFEGGYTTVIFPKVAA